MGKNRSITGGYEMAKKNKQLQQSEVVNKEHYKMYKAGKQWLFAAIFVATIGGGTLLGKTSSVSADTETKTSDQTSGDQASSSSTVTLKSSTDEAQKSSDTTDAHATAQTKTVTRTVNFVDAKGQQVASPVVQEVKFTRASATADWQYAAAEHGFASVSAPSVDGMTASISKVGLVSSVSATDADSTTTVTYKQNAAIAAAQSVTTSTKAAAKQTSADTAAQAVSAQSKITAASDSHTNAAATTNASAEQALLKQLPAGTKMSTTADGVFYALPVGADIDAAKKLISAAKLTGSVEVTQADPESANGLTGGDTHTLDGTGTIASTDTAQTAGMFAANGSAKIGSDGKITLTTSTNNQTGTAIFNNNLDMTKTWTLTGDFSFGDTWGQGQVGWYNGAGAGFIISDATASQLSQGASGQAMGIGGIGNSIVAAIDMRTDNTAITDATAPNKVVYSVGADMKVAAGANDPGTVDALGELDLTGGRSKGGAPTGAGAGANAGLSQAVLKFLTTNEDGTVVKNGGVGLQKAYSPASTVENTDVLKKAGLYSSGVDAHDKYIVTWTPDQTQSDSSRVSGTLTVSFYGNVTGYEDGFTISTQYTSSKSASVGLISSTDDKKLATTATVVATIQSMTGSLQPVNVTVNYQGAPTTIDSSTIVAEGGDKVSVNGSATNNFVAPTIAGYTATVAGLANDTVVADGMNVITVTYTADKQTAQITDGTTTLDTVTGTTGGTIAFSKSDTDLAKTGSI
jgi:hypothetical protein